MPDTSGIDIGRVGLWTFALDPQPSSRARELAAELEALGYGAIWIPEAVGRDPFVSATLLLGATTTLAVATGIANIYLRSPLSMAGGWKTLTEAFPDRFVLGLGVSHAPMVEGLAGREYAPPLTMMRTYLDQIDAAPFMAAEPVVEPRRVLAALGPRMLALAAERAHGAHPYCITAEHTVIARAALGSGAFLAPELKVLLSTDAEAARAAARQHLAIYLNLPNYVNNLRRLGFDDDDLTAPGSDRLVDAVVAWGDEATIGRRAQEHRDAGADHVAVQVIPVDPNTLPLEEWRRLAPVLTA